MESLFNDPPGVYYIPAETGCPARGILLHLYYTRRSELSKKNIISRRKKSRPLVVDDELTASGNRGYQDIIQLFEDCGDDWNKIKECWRETRNTRLDMWQSKTSGLTISDIFESFPFLTELRSDELILQDFWALYPSATVFLDKWKKNGFIKVLNHARSYRDEFARVLINEIDLKENKSKYFLVFKMFLF